MLDPYLVLGLPYGTDEQTLKDKYDELRQKFKEDRFLEGDAGNEAAKKLMELDDAWAIISADLLKQQNRNENLNDFSNVDLLIKDGNYEKAQEIMDSVTVRTAEWHYFQSIIFYKREWLSESRVQLAMAVKMDPFNSKYADALSRMDMIMANPATDPRSFNGGQGERQYRNQNMGDSLCRCCATYCCIECLCSICCRM